MDKPSRSMKGRTKMRRLSKRIGITALMVVGATAGSVALAAWLAAGTGTGYAKASTAQALGTVDVSAGTSATLYPGATGDVTLRIDNPNPYPVRVTSVSQTAAITSDAGPACDSSTGVTFSDQSGLTLDVPAASAVTFTLSGSVAMSNSSDNSCQGAVFQIPVQLTGASQ
jgi:hypothetical protein